MKTLLSPEPALKMNVFDTPPRAIVALRLTFADLPEVAP